MAIFYTPAGQHQDLRHSSCARLRAGCPFSNSGPLRRAACRGPDGGDEDHPLSGREHRELVGAGGGRASCRDQRSHSEAFLHSFPVKWRLRIVVADGTAVVKYFL